MMPGQAVANRLWGAQKGSPTMEFGPSGRQPTSNTSGQTAGQALEQGFKQADLSGKYEIGSPR